MRTSLEKDRWLAVLFLVGILSLIVLVLAQYRIGLPEFPEASAGRTPRTSGVPVDRIQALFATPSTNPGTLLADEANPFYTTFFAPKPAAPPATRKIALTYQGFYETANGERRAFMKSDEALLVGGVESNVIGNLVIEDIQLRTLRLRGGTAGSNVLEFNAAREIEIPLP